MRLIALLYCAATLIASDVTVLPVLELEYVASDSVPAAAWAAQWEDGRVEAAAWWSQRIGAPVVATDLACTNAHLVAGTRSVVGGLPRYVVAGRAQGASPALTAAWLAVANRWPERQATVQGGELILTSADLPAPAPAVTPGWRMTLHLAGAATEAAALMGAQPEDETLRKVLRLIQLLPLRLESIVEPDGRGTLTLNLPPLVLATVDAAIAARLPVAVVAGGAVALDGAKVVATPLPWDELYREFGCTRDEAAAAITGTWAAVIEDEKRVLLVVPASPLATRLVADLGQSFISEPWRNSLLIASDATLIARWKAEPARRLAHEDHGEEYGVMTVDLGRLVPVLIAIHEDSVLVPILEHLPLPQALLGNCGLRGEIVAKELGICGAQGPDHNGIRALLAAQGTQRLSLGRSREGWLRCELAGSVLPWLLPAIALRWFADEAENQEGCVALRATIAELQAAGAGAFPQDLLVGLPQVSDAELAAGLAAWKELEGDPAQRDQLPQEPKLAETGLLTLAEVDSTLLAYHQGVATRAARLPTIPAGVLDLLQDAQLRRAGPYMQAEIQPLTRGLARAGRLLSVCGEVRGLDLCDQAQAMAIFQTSMFDGLIGRSIAALRDEAYFTSILRGNGSDARTAAWLAEPWAPGFDTAWRGERLRYSGWLAQSWLGQVTAVRPDPAPSHDLDYLTAQAVLSLRMQRAWTAADVAAIMRLQRSLELGQAPELPSHSFRSLVAGMMIPAFSMMAGMEQSGAVRHGLMRLGARVALLARNGAPPVDATALSAALGGPLEVVCGPLLLPVTYEPRGERGFRLALDTSGAKPSGLQENTWQTWQKAKRRPAETKLAFPGSNPELIWNDTVVVEESPVGF